MRVLSAGVIPVRKEEDEWLFLVLRAYAYWDFPKGLVEAGERPAAAAIRELREETGIERCEFRWGDRFYETAPYSRGKVARYYVAEVFSPEVRLAPNPEGVQEHHASRWGRYSEVRPLLVPRVQAALDWAMKIL